MLHQGLKVEKNSDNFVVLPEQCMRLNGALLRTLEAQILRKQNQATYQRRQPQSKRSVRPHKTNVKIVMIVQCTGNQHIRILVQETVQLEAVISNKRNHICVLQVPPDTIMFQCEACVVT